jgi:hypothetical protein
LPIQGSRGEEIGEESGGPVCAFVGRRDHEDRGL